MTNDEEWGPWIEHDGSEQCPFKVGDYVQTIGGYPGEMIWNEWLVTAEYTKLRGYKFIVRYRIRKPRAMQILRDIAATPERELETTL